MYFIAANSKLQETIKVGINGYLPLPETQAYLASVGGEGSGLAAEVGSYADIKLWQATDEASASWWTISQGEAIIASSRDPIEVSFERVRAHREQRMILMWGSHSGKTGGTAILDLMSPPDLRGCNELAVLLWNCKLITFSVPYADTLFCTAPTPNTSLVKCVTKKYYEAEGDGRADPEYWDGFVYAGSASTHVMVCNTDLLDHVKDVIETQTIYDEACRRLQILKRGSNPDQYQLRPNWVTWKDVVLSSADSFLLAEEINSTEEVIRDLEEDFEKAVTLLECDRIAEEIRGAEEYLHSLKRDPDRHVEELRS